jgi:hypothetical protein
MPKAPIDLCSKLNAPNSGTNSAVLGFSISMSILDHTMPWVRPCALAAWVLQAVERLWDSLGAVHGAHTLCRPEYSLAARCLEGPDDLLLVLNSGVFKISLVRSLRGRPRITLPGIRLGTRVDPRMRNHLCRNRRGALHRMNYDTPSLRGSCWGSLRILGSNRAASPTCGDQGFLGNPRYSCGF